MLFTLYRALNFGYTCTTQVLHDRFAHYQEIVRAIR